MLGGSHITRKRDEVWAYKQAQTRNVRLFRLVQQNLTLCEALLTLHPVLVVKSPKKYFVLHFHCNYIEPGITSRLSALANLACNQVEVQFELK
jgi:hypothetical protein